jgi:hypothetical protein
MTAYLVLMASGWGCIRGTDDPEVVYGMGERIETENRRTKDSSLLGVILSVTN